VQNVECKVCCKRLAALAFSPNVLHEALVCVRLIECKVRPKGEPHPEHSRCLTSLKRSLRLSLKRKVHGARLNRFRG
jgi:hypothetical protein